MMYWLIAIGCLILAIYIYVIFIAPYMIREKHYLIHKNSSEVVDISNAYDVFDVNSIVTIAHFSDTHFSRFFTPKKINRLIRSTQRIRPEIIVFTGDLIENYAKWSPKMSPKLVKKLKRFSAPMGKIAILGNHDYINNGQYFVKNVLDEAGFTVLKNEEIFGSMENFSITVTGIDDPLKGNPKYHYEKTYSRWHLLLIHEPDMIQNIPDINQYDLILAGHAHEPRKYFRRFKKKIKGAEYFTHGLYAVTEKTILSICNRARRSYLSSRFRLVPEIVYYHLAKNDTNILIDSPKSASNK